MHQIFYTHSNNQDLHQKSQTKNIATLPIKLTPIATLISLIFSPIAFANGLQGMEIISGKASMEIKGATTTIKNSPNTVLNWKSFNINKGDLVNFIQEHKNSAVFNKVTSSQLSQLNGTLKSNGQVFLINPNGIAFGKDSVIDTSGFVASTLNISNEDLKKGKLAFEQAKDKSMADIVNNGLITVAKNGTVALIGGNVTNNGKIKVENGNIFLLAGQKITISDLTNPAITYSLSAPKNQVLNLGEVFANNGKIKLSGGKVTNKGVLNANSTQKDKQGNITLSAKEGEVSVGGKISADGVYRGGAIKITGKKVTVEENAVIDLKGKQDGGTAYIGGDEQGKGTIQLAEKTEIKKGAKIDTSATEKGNGGKVIIWGDEAKVDGKITAKGGKKAGNGGFIETSGKTISLGENIDIDASAKNGKGGEWLLDPDDLKIVSQNMMNDITEYEKENKRPYSQDTSYISAKKIEDTLNSGTSVTQTAQRDLYLQDTIKITSDNNATLNLNAGRDLFIQNPIELISSGNATVKLNAQRYIDFSPFYHPYYPSGLSGRIGSLQGNLNLHLSAQNYYNRKSEDFLSVELPIYTKGNGLINLYYTQYTPLESKSSYLASSIKYGRGNIYLNDINNNLLSIKLEEGNIYHNNLLSKDIKYDLETKNGNIDIYTPLSNLYSGSLKANNIKLTANSLGDVKSDYNLPSLYTNNIDLSLSDNSKFLIYNFGDELYSQETIFSVLKNDELIKGFKVNAKLKDNTLEIVSNSDSSIDIKNGKYDTLINVKGAFSGNINNSENLLIKADTIDTKKELISNKGIKILSEGDINLYSFNTKGDFLVKTNGLFNLNSNKYSGRESNAKNLEVSAKNISIYERINSTGYIKLLAENILISPTTPRIVADGDISIKATGAAHLNSSFITKGVFRLFEENPSQRDQLHTIFDYPLSNNALVYTPDSPNGWFTYGTAIAGTNHNIVAKKGIYVEGDYPKYGYVNELTPNSFGDRQLYKEELKESELSKDISKTTLYAYMSSAGFEAHTEGKTCINNRCNDGSILTGNTFGEMQKINDPWEIIVPPEVDKPVEETTDNAEKPSEETTDNAEKPSEEATDNAEKPSEEATDNAEKSSEETTDNAEKPSKEVIDNAEKPSEEVIDNVEKPSKEVIDNVEKPSKEVIDNAQKPSKEEANNIGKPIEEYPKNIKDDFKNTEEQIANRNRDLINEADIHQSIKRDKEKLKETLNKNVNNRFLNIIAPAVSVTAVVIGSFFGPLGTAAGVVIGTAFTGYVINDNLKTKTEDIHKNVQDGFITEEQGKRQIDKERIDAYMDVGKAGISNMPTGDIVITVYDTYDMIKTGPSKNPQRVEFLKNRIEENKKKLNNKDK